MAAPASQTTIKLPPEKGQIPPGKSKPATGYDKYINWKIFLLPLILFFGLLMMPTPNAMKDVGTEYQVGPTAVKSHIVKTLFEQQLKDAEQWQLLTANIMEQNMRMGALTKERFLSRDIRWCKKYRIVVDEANLLQAQNHIEGNISAESFLSLMQGSYALLNKIHERFPGTRSFFSKSNVF